MWQIMRRITFLLVLTFACVVLISVTSDAQEIEEKAHYPDILPDESRITGSMRSRMSLDDPTPRSIENPGANLEGPADHGTDDAGVLAADDQYEFTRQDRDTTRVDLDPVGESVAPMDEDPDIVGEDLNGVGDDVDVTGEDVDFVDDRGVHGPVGDDLDTVGDNTRDVGDRLDNLDHTDRFDDIGEGVDAIGDDLENVGEGL